MILGSGNIKCLIENRNLAICLADFDVPAVVVVSTACKLCFRYTGSSSTPRDSFHSRGITTDSGANILMSDYNNYRIHILERDARSLRFIQNCDLQLQWGLYEDSRDKLFVPETNKCKVKKSRLRDHETVSSFIPNLHFNFRFGLTWTVNLKWIIKQTKQIFKKRLLTNTKNRYGNMKLFCVEIQLVSLRHFLICFLPYWYFNLCLLIAWDISFHSGFFSLV